MNEEINLFHPFTIYNNYSLHLESLVYHLLVHLVALEGISKLLEDAWKICDLLMILSWELQVVIFSAMCFQKNKF